jgi:hypothetical protein
MKNMVYECKVNTKEKLLSEVFYAESFMNDPHVPLKV